MPAPRPTRTQQEDAHDILAAEAFALPAPDPALHRGLVLPIDPAGTAEPHDILAAEEFAMPAPDAGPWAAAVRRAGIPARPGWAGLAGVGLAGLLGGPPPALGDGLAAALSASAQSEEA